MNDTVWDLQDRAPVKLPQPINDTQQAYESAVRIMPFKERQRFLRAMQTVDAILNMAKASGAI